MNITCFEDLLGAARSQPQPQRLLFAFAKAELPDDAGEVEKARYAQGQGGSLKPVMCVDKTVDEVASFAALVEESRYIGADWDLVFVSTMSGHGGKPPPSSKAEAPLNMMVTYIHTGQLERFLAFSRDGSILRLS